MPAIPTTAGLSKKRDPHLQNNQSQKGWSMAQVIKCLPSKCKALNSNPVRPKEKNYEAWYFMLVSSAIWEVKTGGSQFKSSLGKKLVRP
jgi:hypothetical protein